MTRANGKRDIVERIQGRRERLHINLGPVCNNNCIFCMEENREDRFKVNSALTPDRVMFLLQNNAGRDEVCFTSGEPTLVRELPAYCARARSLGFRRIAVMTNGRRLSYMPYATTLVKAGMNFFYVSIHGHTAKLHDGLARTPGAFEQTLAGIDNLARLKNAGVVLHTSTVVNKRNVRFFGPIYTFLRERKVDQVVFNVMQAAGRAHTHFEKIFPSYTDIARQYLAFIESCGEQQPHAFLVDIPLCITENIPDFNRGYMERCVYFKKPTLEGDSGDGSLFGPPDYTTEELIEVTRADIDASERIKRAECQRCRYHGLCEGVWRNYISHLGWDEFVPIPQP